MIVSDVPASFALVTDSQDLRHIEELTGLDLSEYSSAFVDYRGGDIGDVLGCSKIAPWLEDRVYDVRVMSFPWDNLKQVGLEI